MGGTAIFRCCRKFDCMCKIHVQGRFFSGLWSTPNFLINMYNICQTPEECVKSRLSPQTLISDIINVMKWVEPALENEKSQRGRIGDSCLGFHFFDDAGLRSHATIC